MIFMASTLDFIEYVCEQIAGVGEIRHRKMFGEYMVYVNDKPTLLVCDNVVFVKMLDSIKEMMINAETGFPYEGAKESYILDIDHAEFSKEVIEAVLPFLSVPKPKKKKTKTNKLPKDKEAD